MSNSIEKLIDLFSKFPTVGKRTASRFVFYLISLPKEKIDELSESILGLKNNVKLCNFCFQPFESSASLNLCEICSNDSRNRNILCIVEKETDLISIENKKTYKGLYFILGINSPLFKKFGEELRIDKLKERIKDPSKFGLQNSVFTEVIIATNPTPEGITVSVLVERALKELPQSTDIKITHLAKGLPIGGELEYADEETLKEAFDGRK